MGEGVEKNNVNLVKLESIVAVQNKLIRFIYFIRKCNNASRTLKFVFDHKLNLYKSKNVH